MARKRSKLHRRRKKKDFDNAPKKADEPVDHLMELPEFVLHRILSSLPTTEAIRTSALSKKWRRVWHKLPSLNFSDASNPSPRDFCKDVWKCLRLRKGDIVNSTDTTIVSFKLELTKSWRWSTIKEWFKLIRNGKFKDIDISIARRSNKFYTLPRNLLDMRSLTNVRLANVDLKGIGRKNLQSLSSLSLENVKLDDQALCDLISGSFSLETLRIHKCRGLSRPVISCPKIKRLEIGHSMDGEKFEIEALSNLESFVCHGLCASLESGFSLSKGVKNLSFVESNFGDLWLEDLIFALPNLESLTLRKCVGLKHVKISCPNLRHFSFDRNGICSCVEVNLDCPNLVYFCFQGYLQPNFSINPRNLSEANLRLFKRRDYCDEWYVTLVNFLSSLNCAESLSLDVRSDQVVKIPLHLRVKFGTPLPRLKHMKLRTKLRSPNELELKEVLKWISPSLETLSIVKR